MGAASTLCDTNLHRGQPYFPAKCWRQSTNEIDNSNDMTLFFNEIAEIKASFEGGSY